MVERTCPACEAELSTAVLRVGVEVIFVMVVLEVGVVVGVFGGLVGVGVLVIVFVSVGVGVGVLNVVGWGVVTAKLRSKSREFE